MYSQKHLLEGLIFLTSFFYCNYLKAQVITEPAFPTADDNIHIIYDATKGTSGLVGAAKVYMHSGAIIDSPTGTSWQNVIGNWGQDDGIGLMTKVSGETDKWEITINPRDYFSIPTLPIYRIGMVFRNADGSKEGKTDQNTDIFVNLLQGGFGFNLISPTASNIFVDTNDEIVISAEASSTANFTLNIAGIDVDIQNNILNYSYSHIVTETSGSIDVTITADDGIEMITKGFSYIIRIPSEVATRPDGTKKGINYEAGDDTRVVLCLQAPTNSSAYVIGEFTDWKISPGYKMKKDGEYFWFEVSGLSPGVEYAFRYLVDESIYIADPYSDKILDPDDGSIPSSIYPNLKQFPNDARELQWYSNRLSVIQTGQTPYQWQNVDFVKPTKNRLVIYETLIRDFFGNGQESYANLKDTLSYFKRLGITAIELMPITEFNGNDSWGYNNAFMFAPDKAYGPKNKLKEFIDAAHGEGIAVILDVVMNHHDMPAPNLLLNFNYETFKPNPTNPWFNVDAPHTVLNFFQDLNHNSPYTQNYLDSINHYWINEYHFDGFRFDFSKGFTQKLTTNYPDLAAYDPNRVSILERMATKIWSYDPDAYVILEHFADNSEEKVLSDYGMMLWGNSQYAFKQNALGYAENSSFDWVYSGSRDWNNPNLVNYMESHDEQRLMFENLTYGNQAGTYNAKDLPTALNRMKAVGAFFFSIPGPKMIWQFEELGYDIDINSNGRVGQKPPPWNGVEGLDYNHDEYRLSLKSYFSEFIKLRNTYSIFSTSNVSITSENALAKQLILRNEPYVENPTSSDEMNIVLVGNFDVVTKNISVNFPHSGTWYNYFSNVNGLSVTSIPRSVSMRPGEFRMYTDYELAKPELITALKNEDDSFSQINVYPNPFSSLVTLESYPGIRITKIIIFSILGKKEFESIQDLEKNPQIDLSFLSRGLHILTIQTGNELAQFKIIKE